MVWIIILHLLFMFKNRGPELYDLLVPNLRENIERYHPRVGLNGVTSLV